MDNCDLIVLDGLCVIQVALKELPCLLVEFGSLHKSKHFKVKLTDSTKFIFLQLVRSTCENRPLLM